MNQELGGNRSDAAPPLDRHYVEVSPGIDGGSDAATTEASTRIIPLAKNKLAGGDFFTCGVTTAQTVKCWGSNEAGQLGDGTTTQRATAALVVGLEGVVSITAGATYACALTETGRVACWGANDVGQLGDGTTATRSTPATVVGLEADVVAIDAKVQHACAITSAGAVKCWGQNADGQLGDGTSDNFRSTPVDVATLDSGIVALATGQHHTCALSGAGDVKCWGDGSLGVTGATGGRVTVPRGAGPFAVRVVDISAGWGHSCALLSTGEVQCWGANWAGQVGAAADSSPHPRPRTVSGLTSGVTALASGLAHSCVQQGNDTYCWGWNEFDQLGDDSIGKLQSVAYSAAPVRAHVPPFASGLALGSRHGCAFALDGSLLCWGENLQGQLGDGSKATAAAPGSATAVTVIGW